MISEQQFCISFNSVIVMPQAGLCPI